MTKTEGRLSVLKSIVASKKQSSSTIGIGHTRWATHGEPSTVNSHPHMSQSGLFAVVHNGIIENYSEIKSELIKEGFHFSSATDTEVISNLLEKNYKGDLLSCVAQTTAMLKGSYALCIVCRDFPDKIVSTRLGSPLICGIGKDGVFLSSDILAISDRAEKIYRTEASEILVASCDEVSFFSPDKKKIEKKAEEINRQYSKTDKNGFDHYMLKEIYEQPEAIEDTLNSIITDGKISFEDFTGDKNGAEKINSIYIVACGSAYHVGVLGKYVIERLTGIPTHTDIASEFRYRNPPITENDLCIVISQSGETADSIRAVNTAKEKGARVIGIVNVKDSTIAALSDSVIYTKAGAEIAVATTKAYSAQLSVICCFAVYLGALLGKISTAEEKKYISEILSLPALIEKTISINADAMKELSKRFTDKEHAYFIGRGTDYAIALEGSLKLKEISYIHSEAYGAGELKHGTISLIERGTAVVALMCDERVLPKTVSNAKEVKARHAEVITVSHERNKDKLTDFDYNILIPDCGELISPSLSVIPLQLLSYFTAKSKGCDIDKPRNLAKSVTVE